MRLMRRVLVYCTGLFIMALGVSFSGAADLGMSPVNSIPYVLSEIFTSLSMGTWIIIIFSLYIIIQFIILGILLYLAPRLMSLPGEGIMQVIAQKLHLPLHKVKMCFDITVSLIALAISLAYFRQFHGIREGTVIAAFGAGNILGLYEPLKPGLHRFLHGERA